MGGARAGRGRLREYRPLLLSNVRTDRLLSCNIELVPNFPSLHSCAESLILDLRAYLRRLVEKNVKLLAENFSGTLCDNQDLRVFIDPGQNYNPANQPRGFPKSVQQNCISSSCGVCFRCLLIPSLVSSKRGWDGIHSVSLCSGTAHAMLSDNAQNSPNHIQKQTCSSNYVELSTRPYDPSGL